MNLQKQFSFILFTIISLCISFKSYAEPVNLGLLKKQIMQYHDSGLYTREIEKVTEQAKQYIEQQVLHNARLANPQKLAIVLDIDETCLSNYKNMTTIDFANLPSEIKRQLLAADEPAIKPVHDLYLKALEHNISVFFVTGRDSS
ncbi:MAG TPA: HAD family acid phosphatase, partial [Legionellaceae bacterium]|nr:HAD family acid phosphatase [Legionellaceae bacterium]